MTENSLVATAESPGGFWTGMGDGAKGELDNLNAQTGGAGIFNDAASTLVEQLRANAFSSTKGDWPANWRLYRGTLDGPQTPAPTDAPIRLVIGVKPR